MSADDRSHAAALIGEVLDGLSPLDRRASDDFAGDLFGGQLQADIGPAGLHTVVLAVDDQRPARQGSAIMWERVLDDSAQ